MDFKVHFLLYNPQWFDGNTWNGEVQYGTALHVDEIAGQARAYLTNGERPTANISVWSGKFFVKLL